MKKYSLFSVLSVIIYSFVVAQTPQDYGKSIVKKLASEDLHGRGYTHDGMNLAAKTIAEEFKKIGLTSFNNSFFQELSYPVNIIEDAQLAVNGKKLIFGKDFLVNPLSPSGKGASSVVRFDPNVMDSIYLHEDNTYFFKHLDASAGKTVLFDNIEFPEKFASNGVYAKDLFKKVAIDIADNSLTENIPVVLHYEEKLTHSLAPIASKTIHFIINENECKDSITSIQYDVKSKYEPNFKANNVIGYIQGNTDEVVYITAHYDHLGQVGSTIFPGANDNASGVALMLAMAKYFKVKTPKYTMVFIAFAGEEAGLVGSSYYVKNPLIALNKTKFVLNFDMVGTGDEGIQIVNSKKYPDEYKKILEINQKNTLVKAIKERGESCNSDHCPFDKSGIPAFFTYTLGGSAHYHNKYDTAESITLPEFTDVLKLFTRFIEEVL